MKKTLLLIILMVLASLVALACCPVCPSSTPTPTPKPIVTPIPTATPPPDVDDSFPPCRFYGNVTFHGGPVMNNTIIKAIIHGYVYTTMTPSAHGPSTYGIMIQHPVGIDYQWEHVTFVVNGVKADHEAVWQWGENIKFNIVVTGAQ